MKIKYSGPFAVDIPGHDNVEPGQTVDVSDELAASLLAASVWTRTGKPATTADPTPTAAPATEPADAEKES